MRTLAERPLEDSTGGIVRVSDLRQWTYCPRVVYFSQVCPLPKHESYKMKLGREKEDRLARLMRRRTLSDFGLVGGTIERNVELFSPALGLSGKLDLLIRRHRELFPVEVKFTRGVPEWHHRIQLAGYALLLEHRSGVTVSRGFVICLPDEAITSVPIDAPLRESVATAVSAMREMIRRERFPDPTPDVGCCVDCEYRNFCGDTV